MLIRGINFPDELVSASRDESLVVFAGAGVSMDPPSNYPDFEGLTKKVARGQPLKRGQLDADRFLGKLEDRGVNVRRIVHETLTDPNSKPNPLHLDLLKMFPDLPSVRLITTNFDTHFTAAAEQLFAQGVSTSYAPALPPGRDFSGICYLHGCVNQDPTSLVLTDRDFGRAYVVDGWAARFLQDIFRQFTVLFVGYSHSDPIVHHMARGLPSDICSRFCLIPEGTEENWRFLGITPISYRESSHGKHAMLMEAIAAWEDSVPKPTVGHEAKVKEILSGSPTADPQEDDYVYEVLRNPATVHFFTKSAFRVDWLQWVERKGLLKPLFGAGALDEGSYVIADWFAHKFVVDHPKESIFVVQRNKGPLHPYLWSRIARRLGSIKHPPGAEVLNKWLPVLLAYDHPHYSTEWLEHVLTGCTGPEYALAALVLFRHLTKPTIVLKEELDFGAFDGKEFATTLAYEFTVRGSEYSLRKAWENVFKLELANFATSLTAIITAHFHEAQEMLRLAGQVDGDWDRLSGWRKAIEVHEQDRYSTRPIDS